MVKTIKDTTPSHGQSDEAGHNTKFVAKAITTS
jgi:hypothetical protein